MSIPHIDTVNADCLLTVLKNLSSSTITEKIDGSCLLVGYDHQGLYTSRIHKGGNKVYNVNDYEIVFNTTFIRYAHSFLNYHLDTLIKNGLHIGQEIQLEILYSQSPNVVTYADEFNCICTITPGSYELFNSIPETAITLDVPYTADGVQILVKQETTRWIVSDVPRLEFSYAQQERFASCLLDLEQLLDTDSKLGVKYSDILKTPLNKLPVWCKHLDGCNMQMVKDEKRIAVQKLNSIQRSVKEKFIELFVENQPSKLTSVCSYIEGIVIKCDNTLVKVVDRSKFSYVRERAWFVRNKLSKLFNSATSDPSGTNITDALEQLSSLLHKYKNRNLFEEISTDEKSIMYSKHAYNRTLEQFAYIRKKLLNIRIIGCRYENRRNSIFKGCDKGKSVPKTASAIKGKGKI